MLQHLHWGGDSKQLLAETTKTSSVFVYVHYLLSQADGKTEAVSLNSEVCIWIYFFLLAAAFCVSINIYCDTDHPICLSNPLCLATNVLFAPDEKNQVPFLKGVFYFANFAPGHHLTGSTSEMDRTQTTKRCICKQLFYSLIIRPSVSWLFFCFWLYLEHITI